LTAPFHQLSHETAQAVNLVDQIKHNRDGFIVHTEITAQIADQSRARQVDVGKFVT
jgi:hypothetical protein